MMVEVENCTGTQCESALGAFKWFQADDVTVNNAELWSPEPFLYLSRNNPGAKCAELSIEREIKLNSKRLEVARSINYTEADVDLLYANYLQYCYPALQMNQTIFASYMDKSKFILNVISTVADQHRLFNSFCAHTGSYITFKDFLFTMVVLDRRCVHGGVGGEFRTRCIFRYYAKESSNQITFPETVGLYTDIAAFAKKDKKDDPETAAEELFKKLNIEKDGPGIAMDKFIELVGTMKIRGTASLFRSTNTPLFEIRKKKMFETYMWPLLMQANRLVDRKPSVVKSKNKLCQQCDKSTFSLAIHSMSYNVANQSMSYFQVSNQKSLI